MLEGEERMEGKEEEDAEVRNWEEVAAYSLNYVRPPLLFIVIL